jgi:hypothetical protein
LPRVPTGWFWGLFLAASCAFAKLFCGVPGVITAGGLGAGGGGRGACLNKLPDQSLAHPFVFCVTMSLVTLLIVRRSVVFHLRPEVKALYAVTRSDSLQSLWAFSRSCSASNIGRTALSQYSQSWPPGVSWYSYAILRAESSLTNSRLIFRNRSALPQAK